MRRCATAKSCLPNSASCGPSRFFSARIICFAPATAQKNINLEVLEAVAVPLPPLPEQHRIVAEVDRLLSIARETEAEVDANLKRAQGLRQAILSKAFSA